mgnify:CR=1 FL=1
MGRAQALRRFAFVIYCGKPGQYLNQLPSMQEKLVELMKLPSNNIVHVEVGAVGIIIAATATIQSRMLTSFQLDVPVAACTILSYPQSEPCQFPSGTDHRNGK